MDCSEEPAGAQFRKLRKKYNYSIEDISAITGLKPQTIYKRERSKKKYLDMDFALAMASWMDFAEEDPKEVMRLAGVDHFATGIDFINTRDERLKAFSQIIDQMYDDERLLAAEIVKKKGLV